MTHLPGNWWLSVTVLLFQSHWLDDLGSGEPDLAGMAVSGIGLMLVLGGAWAHAFVIGRIALRAGLVFVIWVSVADLLGLRPDGSLTPDLLQHYRAGLGPTVTVVVALTLVCAAISLWRVRALRASTAAL